MFRHIANLFSEANLAAGHPCAAAVPSSVVVMQLAAPSEIALAGILSLVLPSSFAMDDCPAIRLKPSKAAIVRWLGKFRSAATMRFCGKPVSHGALIIACTDSPVI